MTKLLTIALALIFAQSASAEESERGMDNFSTDLTNVDVNSFEFSSDLDFIFDKQDKASPDQVSAMLKAERAAWAESLEKMDKSWNRYGRNYRNSYRSGFRHSYYNGYRYANRYNHSYNYNNYNRYSSRRGHVNAYQYSYRNAYNRRSNHSSWHWNNSAYRGGYGYAYRHGYNHGRTDWHR